jgi:Na+/melibiose symporter-like transporter
MVNLTREEKMIRSVIAIIVGYFVFAAAAALLFFLSGRDPHDAVPTWFLVTSILYGCAFAALGGYLAAFIARRKVFLHAAILTIIIGTGALVSLLSSPGKGAIWSQLAALLLMAPSAIAGGYLRNQSIGTDTDP